VLLISGSLRAESTNTAVLRTLQAVAPDGIVASLFDGLAELPPFNPDDDVSPLPPSVADLRDQIHAADALLFSTPEYAGALPGSFKNLLDWTIGDDRTGSIYEKPVGWINAAARGAAEAHRSLRLVLGYAHATIVESACVPVPVTPDMIGDDGLVAGPEARVQLTAALVELAGRCGPPGAGSETV
jgi:NAD(P)H-dependent FMN reductase